MQQKTFSQSELYVLSKKPAEISNCPGGNEKFLMSHNNSRYEVANINVRIKLDYSASYNDDPSDSCNGPCGQTEYFCKGVEVDNTLSSYETLSISYTGENPTCQPFYDTCLPIYYQAVLLPEIFAPVDKRCERQELFAQHSDGQDHEVTGLTWQYYTGSTWKDLPNFKNRYPLNVSLLDIFGSSWRTKFTGNLQLRFTYTAPFTNTVLYSFKSYTIQLNECSPKFKDLITTKTTCNYSKDGRLKLKVDRQLINETLVLSLYDRNTIVNQTKTTRLTAESDGTYSYTWLNLDDGTYSLKYQTREGSVSTIPASDPSWASLEYVKVNGMTTFTIDKPAPVTFSITKLNDKNCYEINDGSIQINAQGESNRAFQYQYFKDGVLQRPTINEGWLPFSQPKQTIINKLSKGTYRIQVRDSKKCYFKE